MGKGEEGGGKITMRRQEGGGLRVERVRNVLKLMVSQAQMNGKERGSCGEGKEEVCRLVYRNVVGCHEQA